MTIQNPLRKLFRFTGALVLFFGFFSSHSYAQEQQVIGRVVSATGSVIARDNAGTERELQRRSEIFAGDTVITGPDGLAQFRMVDSAQISFKSDTVFTFEEYNNDGPGGAPDSALMNMVQGGFRTISGTIGDDDADNYEISTQFASIGIRGTTHEAVIDSGALLTGVYDGGTTISNNQGALDTGDDANFDYSQTLPGQPPQGLLQQPQQLGQINLNPGLNGDNGGDDDDADDNDGNDDGDGNNDDGDGNDDANADEEQNNDDENGDNADDDGQNNANNADAGNNDDEDEGGLTDADNEDPGARALGNQQGGNPGVGNNNDGDDPVLELTQEDDADINPVNDVRDEDDFEETGTGNIARGNSGNNNGNNGNNNNNGNGNTPQPEPEPEPEPDLQPEPSLAIEPSEEFALLAGNAGFNTSFEPTLLTEITGSYADVIAFNGAGDIGGAISATAIDGENSTPITALSMTFDLNFSASIGNVTDGLLTVVLGDAPTPITYSVNFTGTIAESIADFIIAVSSSRTAGDTVTSLDLDLSTLEGLMVDDGEVPALFSEFFLVDTEGLGVEGQTLVGIAPEVEPQPEPEPVDFGTVDRLGFTLGRFTESEFIFAGNTSSIESGSPIWLAGNDLTTPRVVDETPPYIFANAFEGFISAEDFGGTVAPLSSFTTSANGNIDYDIQLGLWGIDPENSPLLFFSDYSDNSQLTLVNSEMLLVSATPLPLADLEGTARFMSLDEVIIGGSSTIDGNGGLSAGTLGISEFMTRFNVDFGSASLTEGYMTFCLAFVGNCSESSQRWQFNYEGDVIDGYVVAMPIANSGTINNESADINGDIHGVFTGDTTAALIGGFNLVSTPHSESSLDPAAVDAIFLAEREARFSFDEYDSLDRTAFLVQEGYARILLGDSRATSSGGGDSDIPILFIDQRSRPNLVLRDDVDAVSISQINQGLSSFVSEAFGVDWERWSGPVFAYDDNLDSASVLEDASGDFIHDIAYFSTFEVSDMTEISGRYETVLGYMGEGDMGTAISGFDMSFDINFSNSMNNIENGKVLIDVGSGESWLAFFEGNLVNNIVEFDILESNPFDNSELSGIYNGSLVFQNEIDTDDSNMQGAIVDDGESPALLSSFYFREEAPYLNSEVRQAVMGVGLVGITDDLRFNNAGIDTGGILQSDLNNIGVAVIGNPYDVATNNIEGDIQDYIFPIFGSDTTSISDRPIFGQFTPTNGSNPYYLSLERVFVNQNNSTSSDIFYSNVGGHNVDWGFWDSPGSSNNGLFAFTDRQDTEVSENSFKFMPWLLVNDPVISSYKGTATYSYVVDAIGANDTDEIESLFTAFDVNFDSATVDDGFIEVCAGSGTDCIEGAGTVWSGTFDATISGGFLNSTSVSGTISHEDPPPFSGEIAGAFTSPNGDDSTAPYNAFAGGLNFVNGYDNSEYLSGLFLVEREARLNAAQIQEMNHHVAMLLEGSYIDESNNLVPGSISFGRASHPLVDGVSSSMTSPNIGVNDRGSQVFGSVDMSQPFDEVLTGTSEISAVSNNYVDDIVVSAGGFEVDWGYWNSSNMSVLHNQFDETQTMTPDAEHFWANIIPSDAMEIADRTGSYTYYDTYNFVGTSSNGVLEHMSMYFDVNFQDATPIGTGYLEAGDGELYWDVDITGGTIDGSFVKFTTDLGNLSNWDTAVITPCSECVVADIQGVFTGTETYDMSNNPLEAGGFAAGFLLNNSLDPNNSIEFIQGFGTLESGSAEF
tara:strand:- start:57743 stop:62938 length:5196 start_codon:yes stop_codon:yes gene_type:complete